MKPYLNILFTLTSGDHEITGTLLLPPDQAQAYLAGDTTAMKLALSEHVADTVLRHHELFADLKLAEADDAALRAARQSLGVVVGISHVTLCSTLLVGDQDLHAELAAVMQ